MQAQGGTQEAGASGRPALPDPVKPDSEGGWLSRLSQAGLNRTSPPQQRMRREYFHNWMGIFHEAPVEKMNALILVKKIKMHFHFNPSGLFGEGRTFFNA